MTNNASNKVGWLNVSRWVTLILLLFLLWRTLLYLWNKGHSVSGFTSIDAYISFIAVLLAFMSFAYLRAVLTYRKGRN